jgi:hypothetical protein
MRQQHQPDQQCTASHHQQPSHYQQPSNYQQRSPGGAGTQPG